VATSWVMSRANSAIAHKPDGLSSELRARPAVLLKHACWQSVARPLARLHLAVDSRRSPEANGTRPNKNKYIGPLSKPLVSWIAHFRDQFVRCDHRVSVAHIVPTV
jgi:hypothetical protein